MPHRGLKTCLQYAQVQQVVPDNLLLQLLVAWLSPGAGAQVAAGGVPLAARIVDVENVWPLLDGVAQVCACTLS